MQAQKASKWLCFARVLKPKMSFWATTPALAGVGLAFPYSLAGMFVFRGPALRDRYSRSGFIGIGGYRIRVGDVCDTQ